MPFDIAKIIAYNTNGTWSGNVFTYRGITYTVHEDSSLTVSGIATWTAELDFVSSDYFKGLSDGKVYKISGCPSGGSYSNKYCAFVYDVTTSTRVATDDGSGSSGTFTFNASHQYNIGFVVWTGYDASTPLEVKLMLSLKSDYDADPTWVPPTKPNHQLTQDSVTWDDLSKVGAVNYLDIDASTTVNSSSGLTFTVNSDKTVTVSATSGTYPFTLTALVNFPLKLKPEFSDKLPLKLSGCPSGGDSVNGYNLQYSNYSNTDNKAVDTGDGAIISTQFDYTTYPNAGIRIQLRNGTTLTGPLTFKPMLTDPSYNGPYVPYAKTNKELTDESELITLPATKNDNIVGSFAIRVRKQHNAVYVTGYLNIVVDANKDDLLFTISELNFFDANDKFYILMMSSDGDTAFAEIFSNGEVKVGRNTGMPRGYYMVDSVLLIK
jgi:hypothetical protein